MAREQALYWLAFGVNYMCLCQSLIYVQVNDRMNSNFHRNYNLTIHINIYLYVLMKMRSVSISFTISIRCVVCLLLCAFAACAVVIIQTFYIFYMIHTYKLIRMYIIIISTDLPLKVLASTTHSASFVCYERSTNLYCV